MEIQGVAYVIVWLVIVAPRKPSSIRIEYLIGARMRGELTARSLWSLAVFMGAEQIDLR